MNEVLIELSNRRARGNTTYFFIKRYLQKRQNQAGGNYLEVAITVRAVEMIAIDMRTVQLPAWVP